MMSEVKHDTNKFYTIDIEIACAYCPLTNLIARIK